jgi:hypothetical protein
MSLAATISIGLGFLTLVLLATFEVARVYSEGGLRLFFWPRLNHGYEVSPVTRLSIAPWVLLLFVIAGNGIFMAAFGHDLYGRPGRQYAPWLALALVPLALIHLIDYQRSVIAAVIGLVLLAAGGFYVLYELQAWTWLPLVALLLLWSLNGVRAVHADRIMS